MNKMLSNAAVGASSIVVALSMVATAGAADGLFDAVTASNKLTVKNDATFEYPIVASGNQIRFAGKKASASVPQIDFKIGGSKIYDDGDLTLETDDDLELNAGRQVLITGGRKLSFDGFTGTSTIELFSAGSKTAKIVGDSNGDIALNTYARARVLAQEGLTIGASDALGDVGNGAVTNSLKLGENHSQNVAVVAYFEAAGSITKNQVLVLDETDTTRNDRRRRVTTTTTADDDATIGVALADADAGDQVAVAVGGIARVRISASVTMGAELATGTTAGQAATTTVAPTATAMSLGIALENGSAGGTVAVLIDKR